MTPSKIFFCNFHEIFQHVWTAAFKFTNTLKHFLIGLKAVVRRYCVKEMLLEIKKKENKGPTGITKQDRIFMN